MISDTKCIADMIQVVQEEIVSFVKINEIDAIVNAAKPTLMGGTEQSVDYSIHKAINDLLPDGTTFQDIIKKEVDSKEGLPNEVIRCRRGQAVVTPGGEPPENILCKYVIHVVGTEYDGLTVLKKVTPFCSSSCIQKLESCYVEIIKAIMDHQDIKTVAIPIVSSGNYGFPFKMAVRIALVSIGNALMEWRKKDVELFDQSSIQKIYICIYDKDQAKADQKYQLATEVWKSFEKVLRYGNKVVMQCSAMAQLRNMWEVWKYDENRGYFAVAKFFRFLLLVIRFVFLPVLLMKDLIGRYNWERRRTVVEGTVILKLLFPVFLFYYIQQNGSLLGCAHFMIGLIAYCMIDTVTYLLALIVLSDIQRPSANVIRSMIFLFINYLEVSADMAVIYYLKNYEHMKIREAIQFGFSPDAINCGGQAFNTFLQYANTGIKFFFVTLAFGYFADHLHQREFIS